MVEARMEVVSIFQLLLLQQMAEVDDLHIDIVLVHSSKPRELLLSGLDIAAEVELAEHLRHLAILVANNLLYDGIAPVHQGDLLILRDGVGVFGIDMDILEVSHSLGSKTGILLVLGVLADLNLLGAILQMQDCDALLVQSSVSWYDWIKNLLVKRPQLLKLHRGNVSRCSLRQHKEGESFDSQTPTNQSSHGGEARVIPSLHKTFINESRQSPLGHDSVEEVHAAIIPNMWSSHSQGIAEPVVLVVAVVVLAGTQRVGDAFNHIHNRTGEIIRRVHIVLGASTWMSLGLASVHDRIAKSLKQSFAS